MAVLAKAFNVPFYVAAESYKFARLFPLDQRDLPEGKIPRAPIAAPKGTPEGVATFRCVCMYMYFKVDERGKKSICGDPHRGGGYVAEEERRGGMGLGAA